MPRLLILGSCAELSAGDRVLDACDEIGAPIPFSCRNTSCGICLVRVVSGAELLAPAQPEERSLLVDLGAEASARLACQLYATGGLGTIELEPVGK